MISNRKQIKIWASVLGCLMCVLVSKHVLSSENLFEVKGTFPAEINVIKQDNYTGLHHTMSEDGLSVLARVDNQYVQWSLNKGLINITSQTPGVLNPTVFDSTSDGEQIIGFTRFDSDSRFQPARWSEAQGTEKVLPSLADNVYFSYAYTVSSDGSAIGGIMGLDRGALRPFYFNVNQGLHIIGETRTDISQGRVNHISADGQTVVGQLTDLPARHSLAFHWSHIDGLIILDIGEQAPRTSAAYSISGNGQVTVGIAADPDECDSCEIPSRGRAFRWTQAGEFEYLDQHDTYPGRYTNAYATSHDGSVIIGNLDDVKNPDEKFYIWTEVLGLVPFNKFLLTIANQNIENLHPLQVVDNNGKVFVAGVDDNTDVDHILWHLEIPTFVNAGPQGPDVSETDTITQFTTEGSPLVDSYIWNFGDGTTIQTDSLIAEHTYTKAGTYTVELSLVIDDITSLPFEKNIIIKPASNYEENFESYSVGQNPDDWIDTRPNNSLLEDNTLFSVISLEANNVFSTQSTATNIHSHYSGGNLDSLNGYLFTGRMRMEHANAGIGVTFFSQFNQQDAYYRLRRYGSQPTFKISPHATSVSGDIDSGVNPQANQWYDFKIEVNDTGTETTIKAKIWLEGTTEPTEWQVDALDSSNSRLTSGTIGVWSMASGSKHWDDFLVKSLDAGDVSVITPSLTGMTQSEAITTLNQVGLIAGEITFEHNDTVPEDYVISQTPIAGTSVLEGDAINLVISLGALEFVTVPDVTNLSAEDAENTLVSSGLILGQVDSEYNDSVPAGLTISQNPAAGENLEKGQAVNIIISLGPQPSQIVDENFENSDVGTHPANWFSTAARNSMVEDSSRFNIAEINGNKVFRAGFAPGSNTNIHSHISGFPENISQYEYSGRMMIDNIAAGIGITFFSQYPESDRYYRLRRWNGQANFHLSPHGTTISGQTQSTVIATPDQWVYFKVQVSDTGLRTEIRAKLWQEGEPEPVDWQIDAFDDSGTRLSSGSVGVWSMQSGLSFWDDLVVNPL